MLKIFRKNTKKIIWLLVISFVLWGVSSSLLSKSKNDKYVGEIFEKKITHNDFDEAYRTVYFSPRIQTLLNEKGELSDDLLINSTFQHLAFLKEAKNRHITVSDNEVRNEILERFSPGGEFSSQLYKRWVMNVTGQSPRQYEECVRSELFVKKLIKNIKDKISVTDEEIKDYFYKDRRKIQLEYIQFNRKLFIPNLEYTQDDLIDYYQNNLDKFKDDKKFKFNYILFEYDNYVNQIEVTEEEILKYYEKNKDNIPSNDTDFTPLSDEMKNNISDLLIKEKSIKYANILASDFKKVATDINLLDKYAKDFNYDIKRTPFLTIPKISELIGWSQSLSTVFDHLKQHKLEIIETSKGVAIVDLINIIPQKVIGFNSCEDKVNKMFIIDKSIQKAIDKAREAKNILIQNQATFKIYAKNNNLNYDKSTLFSINDNAIIDSNITQLVFKHMWDKNIDYISDPIRLDEDRFGIFKLLDINDPPEEEFKISKDEIKDQLLSFKQFFELQTKLSKILEKANIKNFLTLNDNNKT